MCALTRFFAVGCLCPLGAVSCAPVAEKAPCAGLVFGVWFCLGFGAVWCPRVALSNPKVCPCEAHAGFGAFLWACVFIGVLEYIPKEEWTCKLLCVSLNLSEWVCVSGSVVKGFFCPYPLNKRDWWCLGRRWCPVIDRQKLSVVSSRVFFFFSLCVCLGSNGMVTFCIIYLRSPEVGALSLFKFSWGKLDFSPWELCFLVLCLGSVVACLPNCCWEHLENT